MTRRPGPAGPVRKARIAASSPQPIAIVGAACRLPGAEGLDAYWDLMAGGVDAVETLPADRFNQARFLHPRRGEAGRSYTFAAGHVGDVAGFDAAAFGLSPREAAEMDPQQRLLLDVTQHAFDDAGWTAAARAGQRIGTYIGGSSTDYAELRLADPAGGDRYFMTGNALSILANRLTNVFDLRGPAQTIDTACSSALVALDLAAQAIGLGLVDAAVVGGVQLLLSPYAFIGFSKASMLSPTGRCHAFGAGADGYVRAEGAGVVVLKPLDAALAAGDRVRAVILATGVNAAGRTIGLSLPNEKAQARLIQDVAAKAGIAPDRFAYFEAHGTGTEVGDPVEAGAIGRAIGQGRRRPLPIGSVKGNIGHLEPASGMAGLLKAMLVLERGIVPPSLHAAPPNPHIAFDTLGLRVVTAAEPLRGGAQAVVGVNSFGFGGTNATVLLGRGVATGAEATPPSDPPPLLLGARSGPQLRALGAAWQARLERGGDVARLARGAARHRDLAPHRMAVRGTDPAAMAAALAEWAASGRAEGVTEGKAASPGRLVFVFSGNGAQHPGMARAALANPAFRAGLAAADAALTPLLGWSVATSIARGVTEAETAATECAQPLIFASQVATLAALAAEGLRPEMVLGHSVGEVAAAFAAGILDLPAAARLIVARSRAQSVTRGQGRMAALATDAASAAPLLAAAGPALEIAAINAPASLTIAGPAAAIGRLVAASGGDGARVACLELDLDYAFHSSLMDPVQGALQGDLADLLPGPAAIPFLSGVTGQAIDGVTGPGRADADYWWRNLRQPVLFRDAARAAMDAGGRVFVEIGSHPVLQSYLRDTARAAGVEAAILPSLTRRDTEAASDPIPAIADRAFVGGADPRGGPAFAGPAERDSLPPTAFARVRTWLTGSVEAARIADPVQDHPLLGFRQGQAFGEWRQAMDTTAMPWLADHALGQAPDPLLPAAAMLDMALAAARAHHPEAAAWEVSAFQILRPLMLEHDRARETVCTLDEDGHFRLESRRRLADEPFTLHARGRVVPCSGSAVGLFAPSAQPCADAAPVAGPRLRDRARRLGLHYGPAFASVVSAQADIEAGIAEIALALPPTAPGGAFVLHPALLDGAFQGLLALVSAQGEEEAGAEVPLPVRVGRMVLLRDGLLPASAHLRVTRRGSRAASADILLRDAKGRPVALLRDLWLQRLRLPGRAPAPEALLTCLLPMPGGPSATPDLGAAAARALRAAASRDRVLDSGDTLLLLEAAMAAAGQAALEATETGLYRGPLRQAVDAAIAEDGLVDDPGQVPAAADIWRQVLAESPHLAPDLAWVARSLETLPAALQGTPQPRNLPPHGSGAFARLAEVMVAAAVAALADWPDTRPLRLLEIGAGGLAAPLVAALARPGRRLVLTIATEAGGAPPIVPDGVEVHRLAWGEEAPALAIADAVLGLGAGALGSGPQGLVPGLAPALAEGALILLAEPIPGRLWDLCCGQDPAWWAGDGLAEATTWRSILEAAGLVLAEPLALTAAPWPALLIAAHRSTPMAAPPADPPHLLIADAASQPLAEALAGLMPGPVERLDFGAAPSPRHVRGARVLVLLSPDAAGLAGCLADLMRLAEACRGATAGFTVAVPDGPAEAAAVLGALRVLANEMPDLAPRRIALAPDGTARCLLDGLAGEEPEQVLGPNQRLAPRLSRLRPAEAPGPRRLVIGQPGNLGTLAWAPLAATAPGPGEVALRVLAAGLNFRDVMWAQGLLPEEALLDGFAGPGLGMECAGVVEAAGPGTRWRPGDRVFGFAPHALASRTITREAALVALPDGLDPAGAATMPVAFLTAIHALEGCAHLAPGETVLIHGGAGGVGLAALQVALAAGARVAATAGTPARRAFLRLAGAELVLDSRDPGFADALRTSWPDGVDVVLNSLAGEAMEQSLGLLKPFGRFLELGKRDYFEDRRVALRPLRRNIAYFGVDVDALPAARPAAAQAALLRMRSLTEQGALRPLPHTIRHAADVESGFRTLQASTHFGKVVILPPDAPAATAMADVADWAPPAGTVVVTGGTAGFGLEAAKWLAARGAKRLALLSRRGPATPGVDRAIAALAALGADASAHACDVGDPASLTATLAAIRGDGPIGGVVHAAAAFDDGQAMALTKARFARVLRPKLDAALALDRLTAADPIGLFLLFSSATTVFGNPGQANYVAANAGLEALARRRHAAGLPALAIAWGPIADAGVLAADAATAASLQRRIGAAPMPARQALDAIPGLLASGQPVVALAPVAWGQMEALLPILAEPLFTAMRGAVAARPPGDLRAELRALPPEEARVRLVALAVAETARILRLAPESVTPEASVASLGLDSLGAMELRTALEQRLGQAVPLSAVTEDLTLALLASRLAEGLTDTGGEAAMDALVGSFEPSPGAD